jgi:MFS family permease
MPDNPVNRQERSTSIYNEKTRKIDKRKRQSAIILVFVTVLIDMLGIFLTIPILANLTREIQGEPDACCPVKPASKCAPATIYYPDRNPEYDYYEADDPDIPDSCVKGRTNANSNIGLANTMYATGTFFSTFWMPQVSDRYGRRPAFFLSLQGSFVGFMLFAFAANFPMLLCVRFVAGMFGGSAVIGNAYITDVYEPHERGPMFARMGATIMMSVLVGPMMGGGLVTLFNSLRAPLFAASGFTMVALFFACFYIKEPKDLYIVEESSSPPEMEGLARKTDDFENENEDGEDDKHAKAYNPYTNPFNLALAAQTFCTTAAFSGLTALLALLLLEPRYKVVNQNDSIEDQGQDMALQLGFNTMIIAACSVPTMLALFPRMVNVIGLFLTGAIGSVMFGLGILFLPFTLDRTAFMLLLPVIGVANGLQMNVSTMALSANAPPTHIASTLAVKQTAEALASMLGPFLTLLYRDGIKPPYIVAGCFGILAGVILVGLAVLKRLREGPPKEKKEYTEMWEKYSPTFLDELEAEARSLPPRSLNLGSPTIDDRLIPIMFEGKTPGVDYDEQFAKDLVGYFDLMYNTMSNQGHLQMIKTRSYVSRLDEYEKTKDDNFKEYTKLRAQELHLQNARRKILTTERTLIERAYPYLPDNDGSLESRMEFLKSIQDLLLSLGFEEWAGEMGERLQYISESFHVGH